MAGATHDDGFHEIQLNGKQLVFLFMAVTVVSVVIFLCGVLVGRGVRLDRPAAVDTLEAAGPSEAPPPPPVEGGGTFERACRPQRDHFVHQTTRERHSAGGEARTRGGARSSIGADQRAGGRSIGPGQSDGCGTAASAGQGRGGPRRAV